jgi:hypothetical protein
LSREDAAIFEEVGRLLRDARRATDIAVQARHIIVLESRRAKRKIPSKTIPGKNR